MCANESRDPDEKSTLIVAPLALLEQWKEEIGERLLVILDSAPRSTLSPFSSDLEEKTERG